MLEKQNPYKDRRIKIALIGCGRISKKHIQAIESNIDRIELIALCDNNQSNLDEVSEIVSKFDIAKVGNDFNPLKYLSFSDLINDYKKNLIKLDLVIITTPSGLHPSQVIAAADQGINVCTEKPMATKWEDALKMVQKCEENKVSLFVVKQNRFNKTLQLLRDQILNGRFGRLAIVTVNVFWHRPQEYYDQDQWRGTWELDGGALMNQASHYVDLLHWLIGPVENLNASISTISRSIEVEDTAVLKIKWENGCLGNMAVTMLTYPKNLEGSITILGEKGTAKIGGPAVNKIEYWMFEEKNDDDDKVDSTSYETTNVYGFGHEPYYRNMLDCLQGKADPICDGKEGLKSLELIIAAYRSAKSGSTIKLPLKD